MVLMPVEHFVLGSVLSAVHPLICTVSYEIGTVNIYNVTFIEAYLAAQ